jgi:hypothetical protein
MIKFEPKEPLLYTHPIGQEIGRSARVIAPPWLELIHQMSINYVWLKSCFTIVHMRAQYRMSSTYYVVWAVLCRIQLPLIAGTNKP